MRRLVITIDVILVVGASHVVDHLVQPVVNGGVRLASRPRPASCCNEQKD